MEKDTVLETKFLKADELISEKKISEAIEMLESIIYEEPNFGKAHNHLGWIYETQIQNSKKAEAHYKQAIKSDPDYKASYINYSYLLSSQNRFEELKQHLDKSISIIGINKVSIYNEYGIMYELQGNFKEAVKHFKLAIQNCLDIKAIETHKASIVRCKNKAGFKSLFW